MAAITMENRGAGRIWRERVPRSLAAKAGGLRCSAQEAVVKDEYPAEKPFPKKSYRLT